MDEHDLAHLLEEVRQLEGQLADMIPIAPQGRVEEDVTDCLNNALDEIEEAKRLLEEE